jgi:thiamine kinase-like enzyme
MTETSRYDLKAILKSLQQIADFESLSEDALCPMKTKGLAHDHIALEGSGYLLRIPKQSQMKLNAADNLAYQAACFERKQTSGHTPRILHTIQPCPALPLGALVVEHIRGRTARLPWDLPRITEALAAIHSLPLPDKNKRHPLQDFDKPLEAAMREIEAQADYLEKAQLENEVYKTITAELDAAKRFVAESDTLPLSLIAFDAHPGNFIIESSGRAVLVDLEKGRYSCGAFDMAHATLYTSTTWDVATHAVLSQDEIREAYERWLSHLPKDMAQAMRPYILPIRRMMWLWSVTWCAKWRVEHQRDIEHDNSDSSEENWSAALSPDSLISHVKDRTNHYLSSDSIEHVRRDWASIDS